MLLSLSGAHGPFFMRSLLILGDSAGRTGVGEVPGGEKIRHRSRMRARSSSASRSARGVGHRIKGDRTSRQRGIGWDAVALGHRRPLTGLVRPHQADETALSCTQFLREAVAYYASLGVCIDRVMTDNGTGYKKLFKTACDELGIRHVRTRPYTQKTNGKAEWFVQTGLREWAYSRPYVSSAQRGRPAALRPSLQLASPALDPQPSAANQPHIGCERPS